MIIKCVKSVCESDSKPGLMQIFYTKDGSIKSARIRHYLGMENSKPRFSYCHQSITYTQTILHKSQQLLIKTSESKAMTARETPLPDHLGQVNGQVEFTSKSQNQAGNECGLSLVWLGHQPPTLTTRVQIPETAPTHHML